MHRPHGRAAPTRASASGTVVLTIVTPAALVPVEGLASARARSVANAGVVAPSAGGDRRGCRGGCVLLVVVGEAAGELGAAGDVELLEDVGEVGFDGAPGDVELLGDLAVAVAVGGERGDAVLGGRERARPGRARCGAGGRRPRAARRGRAGPAAACRPGRRGRARWRSGARAAARRFARRSAAPRSTSARVCSSRAGTVRRAGPTARSSSAMRSARWSVRASARRPAPRRAGQAEPLGEREVLLGELARR